MKKLEGTKSIGFTKDFYNNHGGVHELEKKFGIKFSLDAGYFFTILNEENYHHQMLWNHIQNNIDLRENCKDIDKIRIDMIINESKRQEDIE